MGWPVGTTVKSLLPLGHTGPVSHTLVQVGITACFSPALFRSAGGLLAANVAKVPSICGPYTFFFLPTSYPLLGWLDTLTGRW